MRRFSRLPTLSCFCFLYGRNYHRHQNLDSSPWPKSVVSFLISFVCHRAIPNKLNLTGSRSSPTLRLRQKRIEGDDSPARVLGSTVQGVAAITIESRTYIDDNVRFGLIGQLLNGVSYC